jgi:hypothetical protein
MFNASLDLGGNVLLLQNLSFRSYQTALDIGSPQIDSDEHFIADHPIPFQIKWVYLMGMVDEFSALDDIE